MPMLFEDAEDTRFTFGKYAGSTIGDVADCDILYLDWLYDEMRESLPSPGSGSRRLVYEALDVYMSDEAVKSEVDSALFEKELAEEDMFDD